MFNTNQSTYLIDEFVTVKAGEPYRLFPFGRIFKNGKTREITPEYARRFRLPHFKPAIKLGSHKEETPAGGHLASLFVRETGDPKTDGLWAMPEHNERGRAAVTEGHYRYHSPEVIFDDDKGFEDPTTGELITGPLIVGDALLHMPHLGEAAALYSVEQSGEGSPVNAQTFTEEIMSDSNTVNVPASFLDKLLERFGTGNPQPEPAPQPAPQRQPEQTPPAVVPEQFAALQETLEATKAEMEQYRAEAAQAKAENERIQRVTALVTTIGNAEQFGANFQGDAGKTAAQHLDGMTAETREWAMQQFRALAAQAKQGAVSLTAEIGNGGSPEGNFRNAAEEFNALALDKIKVSEGKLSYQDAAAMVIKERPDLAKGVA